MMCGEITLDTGDRHRFFLSGEETRKLDQQVKERNKRLREEGLPESWNLVKELRAAIAIYLQNMPEPKEEETPAAGTAREPR